MRGKVIGLLNITFLSLSQFAQQTDKYSLIFPIFKSELKQEQNQTEPCLLTQRCLSFPSDFPVLDNHANNLHSPAEKQFCKNGVLLTHSYDVQSLHC